MAIFTPRGLKIRLPIDLAFTYIARLHPKFTAFQVLKTVEGIESIPSYFAFLTGLYVFLYNFSVIDIAIYVGIYTVIGGVITASGYLFVIPYLARVVNVFGTLKVFGVFTIAIITVGLLTVGWKGTLAYFIGRYSAALINFIIDTWHTNKASRKIGFPLTASERNFFDAYLLHASYMGVTTNLELEEGEIESGKWELPLTILHSKHPKVVESFTNE